MPEILSRKAEHIRINLEEDVQSGLTTGLEHYRFIHQALPELDLSQIDLSQVIFNKSLKIPLLISPITGGTEEASRINLNLAQAAQKTGIAMGLGSQRAMIEHPETVNTFDVRRYAPDILLFANLGAIQLNYDYTVAHCKQAVERVQADALILHLNPLQEALQPGGNTRFDGLLKKIEQVCRELSVPVIVKEVGWGISGEVAKNLVEAGVSVIDVAGAGGTSWSQVEMLRLKDEHQARVAAVFRDWGIPTAESIRAVRRAAPRIMIFASGGLRNGIDIAKCVALGASLGGMAGPFLKAAVVSVDEVLKVIEEIRQELQICMFTIGADNINRLHKVSLLNIKTGELCP